MVGDGAKRSTAGPGGDTGIAPRDDVELECGDNMVVGAVADADGRDASVCMPAVAGLLAIGSSGSRMRRSRASRMSFLFWRRLRYQKARATKQMTRTGITIPKAIERLLVSSSSDLRSESMLALVIVRCQNGRQSSQETYQSHCCDRWYEIL